MSAREPAGRGRSPRQIRRRCERIAAGVPVEVPFDAGRFLARLGAARGREIVLLPFDLPPSAPSGVCVSTASRDYVVVTTAATGPQRDHIVLHEVAHLLLEHRMQSLPEGSALFQHLDPRMVASVLGRTNYTTVEEQEAETLATVLGRRARLWDTVDEAPTGEPGGGSSDPLVDRLGRSLEHG